MDSENKRYNYPVKSIAFATLFYLLLPNILFLLGWVHLYCAIPFCFLLTLVTFYVGRRIVKPENGIQHCTTITKKELCYLLLTLLLLFIPMELTGLLAHVPQPSDYTYRNGIYAALIRDAWPLYAPNGDFFVYYHTFFLPPALIAKFATPYISPRIILFAWVYFGMVLATLLLFARFKARILPFLCILFLLGNIADIPNGFLRIISLYCPDGSFKETSLGLLLNLGFGSHLHFLHSWGQFMYTYNSYIPGIIFVALLLSRWCPIYLLPVPAALIVSQTPVVALAVFVLLVTMVLSVKANILRFFNLPNIFCSLFLIIVACYFGCQTQSSIHPIWAFEEIMATREHEPFRNASVRLIRCSINIVGILLPLLLLLNRRYWKTSYTKTIIILTLTISFIWIGRAINEFTIKGPLVLFTLLSMLYLSQYRHSTAKKKFLIILFILASSLHIPGDFQYRKISHYSWTAETIKQNTRDQWYDTIFHPTEYEYDNFFGENKYPRLFLSRKDSLVK